MATNSRRDTKNIIGIHTGPDSYLDHVGILCAMLEIPLIVTEEKTYASAKKFYPQLDVVLKDHLELSLEYLSHFDAIIESGHFWAMELVPLFDLLFNKKMRIIYCPHGNSDKGHSSKKSFPKDISLIYGKQMLDLLKNRQTMKAHVVTGNFRYQFYRQHQKFYDAFIPKKRRKTLLYAPTWPNEENPSNFFETCDRLIQEVAPHFDLIIKLHPFLEELHPAKTHHFMAKYAPFFLTDFPPIYPLLNACDAYLGDFSSIGYDFLAFDKPIFFLQENRGALKECGVVVPQKGNLAKFLTQNWDQNNLSTHREKIYAYSFSKERAASAIKRDLFSLLLA